MRVAFCIDNMNVGGTELNAVRTARELVARDLDLRVFSLARSGPLLAQYEALGVPVDFLPLDGLLRPGAVRSGRELMRRVRRDRIAIVHAHDFYSNVFAAPWSRAGGAAFIASRRWWEGSAGARRLANRASYALANRIVANSPAVARLLVERERVPARRVVVVPNFLDPQAFEEPAAGWVEAQKRACALPVDALVVGSVGSLSPVKDPHALVRAVALLAGEFPNLYVVAVGRDAGSARLLEQLANDLGIRERLRLPGERAQHPTMHRVFDVSVLTSLSEGLPNSVLEAMAAGKPVVTTDVGAVRDAVDDGISGFVVPRANPAALADSLRTLLRDGALRRRMGEAGRRKALESYTADSAIGALLSLYASLSASPPAAPTR